MKVKPQHARQVHALVWSTTTANGDRTWHYRVVRPDGATILYDNTGDFWKMYWTAYVSVYVVRHFVIAGHKLPRYKG